jgi:ATP-dependent DNA helicase RecG
MEDKLNNLESIVAAIERPLIFASKNNFSALLNIKGLEELIPSLVEKALPFISSNKSKNNLINLAQDFKIYKTLTSDEKKVLIKTALLNIKNITTSQNKKPLKKEAPSSNTSFTESMHMLSTPIDKIKGVGPKISESLKRMNINNIEDLLYLIPRDYIDRRRIKKISQINSGEHATIIGKVMSISSRAFAGRSKLFEIMISDGSQNLSAKWFRINAKYQNILKSRFKEGTEVILSGTISNFRYQKEVHHPEIDIVAGEDTFETKLKILPVYPLTEGIHQKSMHKIMEYTVLNFCKFIPDVMPDNIREKNDLIPLQTAFQHVHFPDTEDDIDNLLEMQSDYHRRIVFDEFFMLQTVLALRKKGIAIEPGISFKIHQDKINKFLKTLPFSLTNAQQRSVDDIFTDMKRTYPMNRLIQGDVGSGKTVVSLVACLCAKLNGYQSAIMAPTEILAEQHLKTIKSLTEKLNINVVLLTSSQPKAQKDAALVKIKNGESDIIIGTHALIQEAVEFKKLGFAVIDEQHKFGVMQRAEIKRKGENPDVMVMTATPIPRTLGLTVYGDLDISIINELPPGRKPIKTKVFHENRREDVYRIISQELEKSRQAFIVYPLVEESEKMDLLDATNMASYLQKDIFPDYKVGLVHGRMKGIEKDAIMNKFKEGTINILVSTTVVEVGIDVPNASLIIIEHAERFGLSQLHQLRGRVGRGSAESMCILLAQFKKSDEAKQRLTIMSKTNDGFKIAEEDFNIRGPGEFLGTRQSGLPDFRVAHIGRDIKILVDARKAAFDLIDRDPELKKPEHQLLKRLLLERWKGRLELAGIG